MRGDVLSQVHPTYDALQLQRLRDLYVGGEQMQRRASLYLPQLTGEHIDRYKERLRGAAFVLFLGHIVDQFVAQVFTQPLSVQPEEGEADEFYADFAEDADRSGCSLEDTCRDCLTWALVQQRALVAIDFPKTSASPTNRAEEDASGAARAFATRLPIEQLIDWDYDGSESLLVDAGNAKVRVEVNSFSWAILYRQRIERPGVEDIRGRQVHEWKVWRKDAATGVVSWELYQYVPTTVEGIRQFNAAIQARFNRSEEESAIAVLSAVNGGTMDPVDFGTTSFKTIPLVELKLPYGLWLGNKIGPLNLEHFERRGIILAGENKGILPQAYVKLASEFGGLDDPPAINQSDPNRGLSLQDQWAATGYGILGSQDDIGFNEPNGGWAELAERRLGTLEDTIYRVSSMMASSVSSTSSAVGRSGASKAEDRHATTIICEAFGAIVKEFAKRIYRTISEGRGEQVEWKPSGLDKYALYDRDTAVAESKDFDPTTLKSKTFTVEYLAELARRIMPNLSAAQIEDIRSEIEESAEKSQEMAEQAALGLLANAAQTGGEKTEVPEGTDDTVEPSGPPVGVKKPDVTTSRKALA